MKNLIIFLFSLFFSGYTCIAFAKEKKEMSSQLLPNKLITETMFFKVLFNKEHCGWASVREKKQQDQITSIQELFLEIDRESDIISFFDHNEITENKEGLLIKKRVVNYENNVQKEVRQYEIDPQNPLLLTLTTQITNGEKVVQQISLKQPLTGPYKLRDIFCAHQPFKPGDQIVTYEFDIDLVTDSLYTITFVKTIKMSIHGQEVEVFVFNSESKVNNTIFYGQDYFLANGINIYNTNHFMNIQEESILVADLATAKEGIRPSGALGATDIIVPNLDNLLSQPSKGIRYLIEDSSENIGKISPSIYQKVIPHPTLPQTWFVDVYHPQPQQKMSWPYQGKDSVALAALQATPSLEVNHPEIKQYVQKLLKGKTGGDDAYRFASLIARTAYFYIENKNYEHTYDSALQVLRHRSGDCTEHSVLTIALCRAVGIPARPAFGLVYSEKEQSDKRFFIGHQWVEVWINGDWYPLDPALFSFSVDHIRLSYGNGELQDSLQMLEGYEKVKFIKVHSAELIK